ncbi:3-beta-hydroxysteroid dehydrogenase [White-tailed deer poxvirus]|nr:3-beta-hydroxysteroid dehydrogenase [White-tailed deer poxvirus]
MSVYAVLGGCGFIGKFIVKLLLECDKLISEIRIIDIKTDNKESIKDDVQISYHQCDVCSLVDLTNILKGVDLVITTVSISSLNGVYTDEQIYDMNITSIKNVVTACVRNGIEYLIYTGDSSSIGPNKLGKPFFGNENTSYESIHDNLYCKSKLLSEEIVISSNGINIENLKTLKTCVLRPVDTYGEENYTLKRIYEYCKNNNNMMPMVVPKTIKTSRVYVGNVAWMHVLAARQIQNPNSKIPGNVYYCYDLSPCCEYDVFNLMLMEPLGIEEGKQIPLWISKIASIFNKKIRKNNPGEYPMLSRDILFKAITQFIVNTNKANDFGYKPIFFPDEAFERTTSWLKCISEK